MTGASSSPPREGHHLVAIGVTTGLTRTADRLTHSLESVTDLFRDVFGYRIVPGFGLDPRTQDVRTALRAFARERSPEDTVVVYHTGHADIVDDEHRLWMGDTDDPRAASLRASELVSLLLADTPLRRLMIILDACFAGTGGAEALMAGMRAGRRDNKSLVLITSAHPLEQVRAGDFAGLFTEAVHHPSTAGYEPRHLDPRVLIQHIHDNDRRPGWQTVSESTLFNTDRVPPFLPNPRYDTRFHDLDLRTQLQLKQGKLREEDLREHFLPRARGVISQVESDWRFEGRDAAMRTLSAWLADCNRTDPRDSVTVVTGDMGSGKSAVLGRLVVLSNPQRRGSVPVQDFSLDTLPPLEKITAAVHARLLTTGQVLDALCAAAGVVAETLGEFLTRVGDRDLCVVIDALDEAMDPRGLVRELLRPLVDVAAKTRLRLLLGCRRHVLDGLGDRFTLIDLDDDTYADRASVVRYARRCLTVTGTDSPYHRAPAVLTDQVAEAIGEAAVNSFLVALITATSLALRQRLPDPTDIAWRAALPRTAADAMRDDLEFRLGDQAQRALDLLVPLAFAQGSGLPWENMWPGLASQLSGRVLTDEDVVWLREEAGCYVVEAMAQERSVYRLYHAAMAEYVREGHDPAAAHDGFVTYLSGQVPGEERPAWERANPYTRRHLATHARLADRLDGLVTDPGYLVAAERDELVAALPSAASDPARQAAHAYQRAMHRMGGRDAASYLQLAAHRVGSLDLAERITARFPNRDWGVCWSAVPKELPHRVVARLPEPITHAYALVADPDEPALLLAVHGARVTLLDPDTGQHKASWSTGGPGIEDLQLLGRKEGSLVVVLDSRARLSVLDAGSLRQAHQYMLRKRNLSYFRGSEPVEWLKDLIINLKAPEYGLAERTADARTLGHPLALTGIRGRIEVWDLSEGVRLYTGWNLQSLFEPGDLTVFDSRFPDLSIMEEEVELPERWGDIGLAGTDGRRLLVSGDGASLVVEGIEATGASYRLNGHLLDVTGTLPLPRGRETAQLVSFGQDGTLRIWDPEVFEARDDGAPEIEDDRSHWENRIGGPTGSAVGTSLVLPGSDDLVFVDALSGWRGLLVRSLLPGLFGPDGTEFPLVPVALAIAEVIVNGVRRSVLLTFGQHDFGGDWDIWDPRTGEHLARCPGADTFVHQMAVTEPTGRGTHVVTTGHGSHVLLWRLTARVNRDQNGRPWTEWMIVPRRRLSGIGRSHVAAVAAGTAPNGRTVVVTGDANGGVATWRVPSGRRLRGHRFRPWWRGLVPGRWGKEGVRDLEYTQVERGLPVVFVLRESGVIEALHARRGKLLDRLEHESDPARWLAVRQSSNGPELAECGHGGRVRLWRLEPDRAAGKERRRAFVSSGVIDLEVVPTGLCFVNDRVLTVTARNGVMSLDLEP